MASPVESTPHIATVPGMTSDDMKAKKRPLRGQGEGKTKDRSGAQAENGKEMAMELECEHLSGAASRVPAAKDPARHTASR